MTEFDHKIESLIREQTKFMDIRRLHELYLDLGKSRRVQDQVQRIVRTAQEQAGKAMRAHPMQHEPKREP